jgi:hypothetical protein
MLCKITQKMAEQGQYSSAVAASGHTAGKVILCSPPPPLDKNPHVKESQEKRFTILCGAMFPPCHGHMRRPRRPDFDPGRLLAQLAGISGSH